jgi:hypothetical protein
VVVRHVDARKRRDIRSGQGQTSVLDGCQRIKNGPVMPVSQPQRWRCGASRLTRLSKQLEMADVMQIRRCRRCRGRVWTYAVMFDRDGFQGSRETLARVFQLHGTLPEPDTRPAVYEQPQRMVAVASAQCYNLVPGARRQLCTTKKAAQVRSRTICAGALFPMTRRERVSWLDQRRQVRGRRNECVDGMQRSDYGVLRLQKWKACERGS